MCRLLIGQHRVTSFCPESMFSLNGSLTVWIIRLFCQQMPTWLEGDSYYSCLLRNYNPNNAHFKRRIRNAKVKKVAQQSLPTLTNLRLTSDLNIIIFCKSAPKCIFNSCWNPNCLPVKGLFVFGRAALYCFYSQLFNIYIYIYGYRFLKQKKKKE